MINEDEMKDRISKARMLLKGIINDTSLHFSKTFSSWSGGKVYLKPENLQKVGSFKIRGTYNCMSCLLPEQKARGVVAASSGNHAQGVAYAASLLGIRSVIVMPLNASKTKVEAVKSYGGKIPFCGYTSSERIAKADEIAISEGLTMIHPFNNPLIIAGHGTIGLEILEELADVDLVLCPVGGGGLISGIAVAIKGYSHRVKVIGVEAEGAPSMTNSLKLDRVIKLDSINTIADGIRTDQVSDLTFSIAR